MFKNLMVVRGPLLSGHGRGYNFSHAWSSHLKEFISNGSFILLPCKPEEVDTQEPE